MHSVDEVLTDPAPDALVVALAESSVNIRARWWVKPPRRADTLNAQDKVLSAIKKKLTANGIDMPFPTQQILFHDQTEETGSIGGCLRKLAEMRSQRDGNGHSQNGE